MNRGICRLLTACLVAIFAELPLAFADIERPMPGVPDYHGILWDTPVYDPDSKKYYALIWSHRANDVYSGFEWARANAQAKQREYKGVRGRLAIVDSLEVHEFLQKTFHPNDYTWIGLYYTCATHQLYWATGEPLKPGFQAWDAHWKQDVGACASGDAAKDYMPIAYSPVDKGFRWIGKGRAKQYYGYFIEFPTGQP